MSNWKQGLLGILLMAFQINNRLLLVLVLLFTVSCSQVLTDDTNSFSRYFQTHSVILLYSKLNFGGIHLKYSHRVSRIYLFFFSEHQDICSHWALWPLSFLHPWLSQLHWQGFQDLICKGISTPWDLHLIIKWLGAEVFCYYHLSGVSISSKTFFCFIHLSSEMLFLGE